VPGDGSGQHRHDEVVEFGRGRSARRRWRVRALLTCLVLATAAGGKLVAVNTRTGRAESLGVRLPAVDQVAIRA
jgi:hypothetical protein